MSIGVTYIASYYSSKPRQLAVIIQEAMNHRGFSIVHVQSPCTTYNDTYDLLKGKPKEGIAGLAFEIPEDHAPRAPRLPSTCSTAPVFRWVLCSGMKGSRCRTVTRVCRPRHR